MVEQPAVDGYALDATAIDPCPVAGAGTGAGADGAGTDRAGADGAALSEACTVGVQADLGWALTTVLRGYRVAADEAVADLPGGSRGYRLLSAIVHDCPSSQLALAQRVGLDRTVVTYLVDDLVAAGLVERVTDPADRRSRRVVATSCGTTRLGGLDRRLHEVEQQILSGLGAADRVVLRSLLQTVAVGVARAHEGPRDCAGDPGPCAG